MPRSLTAEEQGCTYNPEICLEKHNVTILDFGFLRFCWNSHYRSSIELDKLLLLKLVRYFSNCLSDKYLNNI